jgi:hypothetical protein
VASARPARTARCSQSPSDAAAVAPPPPDADADAPLAARASHALAPLRVMNRCAAALRAAAARIAPRSHAGGAAGRESTTGREGFVCSR